MTYGRPKVKYIGKVMIGAYAGFEFSFMGLKSMLPFFNFSGISMVANNRLLTHKGCHFRRASPEEHQRTYPEITDEIKRDLIEALEQKKLEKVEQVNKENLYIVGTVCRGRFAGTQFSFAQLKDAPLFFNTANISRVLKLLMTNYRGCTFRKAPYEEAAPYLNNFTHEVLADLTMMFQPASHIWAIPVRGKYKDVRFFLDDKKQIQGFFSPQSIYKILLGINEEHLGFTFEAVKPGDENQYQKHTLTKEIFYAVQSTLSVCFICTLTEWPFKNIEVGFVDKRIIHRYFNMNSVRRVLNGRLMRYKRCTFRKAPYEEAVMYVNNLTPDIADYLS